MHVGLAKVAIISSILALIGIVSLVDLGSINRVGSVSECNSNLPMTMRPTQQQSPWEEEQLIGFSDRRSTKNVDNQVRQPFVLVRILGNDIPRRHMPGQTFNNTLFILEHESAHLRGLDRLWVLNRIINQTMEREIAQLLERFGQTYWIIPFRMSEWAQQLQQSQQKADNYVVNLNPARNDILHFMKLRGYKWILPWDGNSFLTRDMWDLIIAKIEKDTSFGVEPQQLHYLVPLRRLHTENEMMLRSQQGTEVISLEGTDGGLMSKRMEPQIILSNQSKLKFDENLGYGQNNKIELINRISELRLVTRIEESYVVRLFSGNEMGEKSTASRVHFRKVGMASLRMQLRKQATELGLLQEK